MEVNMGNLDLYEKFRVVPEEAQKKIEGGRLKGFTDINPMWRIKKLTEEFGVCGIGWKTQIVRTWLDNGDKGEVVVNVEILLFVKINNEWSEGIPGMGGSKLVAKESGGLFTDDECYKKAYTDALSVACKALGIGADIYYQKDASKYQTPPQDAQQPNKTQASQNKVQNKSKWAIVNELIKDSSITLASVNEWILKKFEKAIKINNLSDEQFNILTTALKKQIEREEQSE